MLNSTVVPIMVFVFLLVPPIVIGFFRGWKAALFIALITLCLIVLEGFIGYWAYDSLWNLFKDFYIKDLQPGLSKEGLKDISRNSVIILFIGACMVPTYLVVMLTYWLVRKYLLKHLYPKTQDINENQKNITRSVHWASRFSGVFISTTSSLFFASTAATASAVIFTDENHKNGFTDFTNKITKLYTFGKGGYSLDLLLARTFAQDKLTPEQQARMMNVLFLGTMNNPKAPIAFRELSSGKFHNDLLELANAPDAFAAIAQLVLTSENSEANQRIFLKDNSYQAYDVDGQKVGNAHVAYNQLEMHLKWFDSLPSLNWHLSDSIINKIVDYIRVHQFKDYKDTGFYKQWEDGANMSNTLAKRLEEKKNEKANLLNSYQQHINQLRQTYEEIKNKEQRLHVLGISNDTLNNKYNTIEPLKTPFEVILTNQGEMYRIEQEIIQLVAQRTLIQAAKAISDTDFVGSPGATIGSGGSSKVHMDLVNDEKNKQHEVDTTTKALTDDKDALARAQELIKRAIILIAKYENRLKEIPTELVQTKNESSDLGHAVQANRIKLSSLNTQISDLQSEISVIHASILSDGKTIKDLEFDKNGLESAIATSKSQLYEIETLISNNENTIKSLQINIDEAQLLINKNNNILNALNGSPSSIADNADRIASLTAEINDLNKKISNWEETKKKKEIIKSDAETHKAKIIADITRWENGLQAKIDTIADRQKILNENTTLLNQKKTTFDRLSSEKNQLNLTISNDLSKLNALQVDITRLEAEKKSTENLLKASEDSKVVNENKVASLTFSIPFTERALAAQKGDLAKIQQAIAAQLDEYNEDKAAYDKNNTDLKNKEAEIKRDKDQLIKYATEKNDAVQTINNDILKRDKLVAEIYQISDDINIIDSKTTPPNSGEVKTEGVRRTDEPSFVPSVNNIIKPQSKAYYDWATNTIPGIEDYIKHVKGETGALEIIKNTEMPIYEKLINDYLNTLRNILKS